MYNLIRELHSVGKSDVRTETIVYYWLHLLIYLLGLTIESHSGEHGEHVQHDVSLVLSSVTMLEDAESEHTAKLPTLF